MQPSWRETSSVCTEAGNFHGGNHSRGAYRSQFETMNSYAALNKGSYRNAAKKVSGSSKCAPPYPACEKYTTSSSRFPKTFNSRATNYYAANRTQCEQYYILYIIYYILSRYGYKEKDLISGK